MSKVLNNTWTNKSTYALSVSRGFATFFREQATARIPITKEVALTAPFQSRVTVNVHCRIWASMLCTKSAYRTRMYVTSFSYKCWTVTAKWQLTDKSWTLYVHVLVLYTQNCIAMALVRSISEIFNMKTLFCCEILFWILDVKDKQDAINPSFLLLPTDQG